MAIKASINGAFQVDILPVTLLENALFALVQAQGITDQAGWNAFVNSLFGTLGANEQTLLRGFFRNAVRFT
jgi:hypothetical protein